MKKQQHLHHRGASTSSIVNKEFFIPLHRSITDNYEEKRQQDKHRSPIAKFVCKLLGLDSHHHRHHHSCNSSNNNNGRRPKLDHKSNSTTSITKSSVIQISSSLSTNNNNNNNNNNSNIQPSINNHHQKEQEDNCSIHSSASSASSSSSLISASISSSSSNNNNHHHRHSHSKHKHNNNNKSSSSTITSKPLESSLSSLTDSVITNPQNDCILIHHQQQQHNDNDNKEELSYHHYNPIKNDQLSAMDALVIASQLPTVRKIQFVDDALDIPPPTLTDRYSFTNPLLNESLAEQLRPYLPRRYRLAGEWNLLYSLDQHGASLSTLYNHVDESGPCILILKDDEHQVFGAFLNEYIHPETSYYGTGECFLWKMTSNDKQQQQPNHHPIPKIKTFSFTGRNDYMIYSTNDCIAIGGGHGKFGLWLNKDLEKCHSEPCDTFDNECLSLNHHFNCIGLEIWSFRF